MIRLICTTNHCGHLAAQLHHAAQTNAALTAQLAQVAAERDELAARLAAMQDLAAGAMEGREFYYQAYSELQKGAQHGR